MSEDGRKSAGGRGNDRARNEALIDATLISQAELSETGRVPHVRRKMPRRNKDAAISFQVPLSPRPPMPTGRRSGTSAARGWRLALRRRRGQREPGMGVAGLAGHIANQVNLTRLVTRRRPKNA